MNRRGFLSLFGAAAVAPLVPLPDLILPTRTIFLPPRGGWLLTPALLYEEAWRVLHENMRFVSGYDIWYDGIVCTHDVMIGAEQFSVDHFLSTDFGEKEAKEEAASLLINEIRHRGLSMIDIRRPPRYEGIFGRQS